VAGWILTVERQDMQSIDRFVAEQLAAWEVPGCAAVAVQDGQVVLATGWGQRDLDTKLPVTADTLFAIGSTTKAFTAATVGALVDDGLLEWEHPLRDYVPELQLYDAVVTDRRTVVDLLSHRSGLPRHEMVWLGHPSQVLRRLCGTYAMGTIEVVVALRGDRVLTVATPGAPPFELEPSGRGLRFGLKGQPAVTAEFELDESGHVTRLVAQPLGIFLPTTSLG